MSTEPIERLGQLFEQKKCWMIDELSNTWGYAVISIRRFLKQIKYYRSYSHNGKWYTLRAIPRFNRNGIWRYQKIGFSSHGNLTQTIVFLINKSKKGITAKQLADKLYYTCHAVLTNMYKAQLIDRVKHRGEFVYLSTDDKPSRRQRRRLEAYETKKALQSFNAQTAVFILVAFIKNPQWSYQQIAAQLKYSKNIVVRPEGIERFFERHGIKKMPDLFR